LILILCSNEKAVAHPSPIARTSSSDLDYSGIPKASFADAMSMEVQPIVLEVLQRSIPLILQGLPLSFLVSAVVKHSLIAA